MNAALSVGPFTFSYSLLLLIMVAAIGLGLARHAQRDGEKTEPIIFRLLVVALLAARMAFVWRYKSFYFGSPWTIVDIRDGGWDAQFGVVAAWLYAFVLVQKRPLIRKRTLAIVAVCSGLWVGGSVVLLFAPQKETYAPQGQLTSLEGVPVELSSFNGKITIINFWATWCPPCQREMPAMERVQTRRPDVNVVFLNQQESAQIVQQFLDAGRLNLKNVLLDANGTVARDYAVLGYPTTLFFDAQGKLVEQHLGEMSDATLAYQLDNMTERPKLK